MNRTDIYIARHGETEYNRANKMQGRSIDISLNETGREQAYSIAAELEEVALDHMYCSSLLRARETAEIIGNRRGIAPDPYPELDEMNFGIAEGKPAHEVREYLDDAHDRWRQGEVEFTIPGGESPAEVLDRAGTRVGSLLENSNGKNVLFVLHGRLIRILVSTWLGHGLEGMHKIRHQNGSMYHLQWDGSFFKPVYLNKTSHLTVSPEIKQTKPS